MTSYKCSESDIQSYAPINLNATIKQEQETVCIDFFPIIPFVVSNNISNNSNVHCIIYLKIMSISFSTLVIFLFSLKGSG